MMNLALVRPRGATQYTFSYPDYEAYRDSLRSFRGVIGFATDHLPVSDGLGPPPAGASRVETVFTYIVSENYFTVLGMKAVRGRTFDEVTTAELVRSPAVL